MTNQQNNVISGVDLFCGVGGLTYGLEKAGINITAGVDVDPSCEFPYSENTQASFVEMDVAKLTKDDIRQLVPEGHVFLLAGCAPCQPFSTYSYASKKRRQDSEKIEAQNKDWELVERFADLIRDLQPDLVTMENVPPLKDQPVFQKLLSALDGYFFDFRVINCETIGLPQSRARLVLVASKLGMISLPEDAKPSATVRDVIGNLPALEAGETDPNDKLHTASGLSETNLQRIRASKPGGTWRDWPEELKAACHKKSSGKTYPSVYGRMEWDKAGPTMTTQCFGYGNGRFGHPEQDRAISLREAAMLQGFPYDYKFLKDDEKPSFSKIGRLIGNAVPVTLGSYIGELLTEHVNKFGKSA